MGVYENQILPRLTNLICGIEPLRELRARVAGGLSGTVVEVGFGSGLNLPYLPAAVDVVLAVDPAVVGRRLAARRLAASPVTVEFVGLDGQDLPLADASADTALSTFTLCTIPEASHALAELRRVLRPGGTLHFLEHGLSPDPAVARWQHRLTPLQRRVFGGCHLDRPIDTLVASGGFEVVTLRNYYVRGPKPPGYIYEGVARRT
ncbi:MAG TPA: class I SAM-dependent methyltransferase [Acidimicrobiales bacterium]|nr:class I SAM-dependent methyltransferase [Acidimicrobiales bacterium]